MGLSLLVHVGAKPSETIYIDDIKENIEGARKLGIDALHFKHYTELLGEITSREL
jgi:FMN phosphatase YigB (HAD superfamily)